MTADGRSTMGNMSRLREAGLDSLMSITVINDIEEVFGTRLPARALLQGPSIAQLADMVLEALPGLSVDLDPHRKAASRARPSRGTCTTIS